MKHLLYLVLREGSRSGDCSLESRLQKRKKWQKPNENRDQEMQCLFVQKIKTIVCAVYYIIKKEFNVVAIETNICVKEIVIHIVFHSTNALFNAFTIFIE